MVDNEFVNYNSDSEPGSDILCIGSNMSVAHIVWEK